MHRDLKPDNIFVSTSGHAKVLAFGLAKLVEGIGAAGTGLSLSPTVLGTVAGQIMGTAGYMAPEQVNGEADIDQRADLFAFGCLLYEMIAGARAFGGATVLDSLHAITRSEPKSLTELAPQLPAEMHRIVKKCLVEDLDPGPGFQPAPPQRLVGGMQRSRGSRNYDLSADGKRVLVTRAVSADDTGSTVPSLRLALNWFEEFKQKLPPR